MAGTHYDTISSDYDDLFAFRKQYEETFINDVFSYISKDDLEVGNMVLVDMGSGTGEMLKLLSRRAVFGRLLAVEPCANMLNSIEDLSTPVEKFCLDGETFSELENIRYDTSIMYGMIHHFPATTLPEFLGGVYSQTNPGGTILVSTYSSTLPFPFWPGLVKVVADLYPTWDNLQETIRQAGFSDVTCVKRSYGDVVIARDTWLHMLRNRFVSPMSRLSDEEIANGIREMDYPDPVVFKEYQYFVKGEKALA